MDLITEYFLIVYFWLLPFIKRKPPANWGFGEKGNVILIPGFQETYLSLYFVANYLNANGYKIHIIQNFNSLAKIEQSFRKLEEFILKISHDDLILLSHSKGGLIAKHFLDNSSATTKVAVSISIATPYMGTYIAKQRIINFYPSLDNHVIPNKNLLSNL